MALKHSFPEGFVWGTSTAGHQVEGHNMNTDWGKFEREGKVHDGTQSGNAVDYWNRYEEDHDLMVKLGYRAFRLGIEWGKIEPEDGKFDREAIERYKKILQSLRDHGLKICLTIYHWVLPLWFAEKGGWMREDAVERFMRFAKVVVEEFSGYPDLWVTLNEPMVPSAAGYLGAEFPPEIADFRKYCKVTNKLLHCHARSYDLIHNVVPKAPDGGPVMAGVATAYQLIEPWGTPGPAGLLEKIMSLAFAHGSFRGWDISVAKGKIVIPFGCENLALLRDSYDYCGVNYYMRSSIKFDPSRSDQAFMDFQGIPEGIEETQMGWQVYPPGLHRVLMEVWKRFRKPIFITENGIADDKDEQRPRYTLEHLTQVHRAIKDGADVRGYYHWSYIDNFEWKEGFSKRFGLVQCDHDDPKLERKPRQSAYMYSDIVKENGITDEIVDKYAPDARDGVFGNKWMI